MSMFWPKGSGCCCGGCGSIDVTVRLCSDNSLISGATVTVKDGGGTTVGSGTTPGSGFVSIDVPSAATYTVTVAKSGQATATTTVSATCSANAVSITLGRLLTVTVTACSVAPVGQTVTATLSGRTFSAVTNGSGVAVIPVTGTGTYTIATTHASPRFAAYSASVSVSTCSTSHTATMVAASGYVCLAWTGFNCDLPVARTLFATDSVHGAVTLVYDAGLGQWLGSKAGITFPACDGCVSVTQTLTFRLDVLNTNPTGTAIGNRTYKRSTTRNQTGAPFGLCLGTDAEVGVGLSPVAYRLSSRTCPTSFSFTSTTITRVSTDCNATNSTLTITE